VSAFQEALSGYLATRKSPAARWQDVFPYEEPSPPATAQDLQELEQQLGRSIPASLRTLLQEHNGYPSFFQSVDILSTHQIVGNIRGGQGKELLDMAIEIYGAEWDDLRFASAIVIGLSAIEGSMFLLNPHRQTAEGEPEVVWFHNEIVERRDTLAEFLNLLNTLLRA
jgi:hypothetical protein